MNILYYNSPKYAIEMSIHTDLIYDRVNDYNILAVGIIDTGSAVLHNQSPWKIIYLQEASYEILFITETKLLNTPWELNFRIVEAPKEEVKCIP